MTGIGTGWTYRCRNCGETAPLGAERVDLAEIMLLERERKRETGEMVDVDPIKKKFACSECHFPIVRQFPVRHRTRVKKVLAR